MEDPIHAVFNSQDEQIIYKQILSPQESDELNRELLESAGCWQDGAWHISTGHRLFVDIDLSQVSSELNNRLPVVLRDYLTDVNVNPEARFYTHHYGRTKPHKDGNRDGVSNYTLLLYLTDEFDDGRLSIKAKRSEQELVDEPEMKHKVFTLQHRAGYGVIFDKQLLHWAEEINEGQKNFLLIHLHSVF